MTRAEISAAGIAGDTLQGDPGQGDPGQGDARQGDTRESRIARILTAALAPEVLEIRDESHKHLGHGGWREGGETHYEVLVVASRFAGLSRVDRQRQVNALLAREFAEGLHALALTTLTPQEAARRARA